MYVHDIYILYNNRMAAWIGYYRITPDIIVYFPYTYKFNEIPFWVAKMYENHGIFYTGTKI